MRKNTILGVCLVSVFAVLVFVFTKLPAEAPPVVCSADAKICPDGSSVGRVAPRCEFAPCPIVENPPIADNLIVVDTPKPNRSVSSPITISGKARGTWFFEASFPIVVTDWDGVIIGQGIATAQGEWMTSEFVPFTASITYTLPANTPYKRGTLILKKDNPSGLPEHEDSREIPILFE